MNSMISDCEILTGIDKMKHRNYGGIVLRAFWCMIWLNFLSGTVVGLVVAWLAVATWVDFWHQCCGEENGHRVSTGIVWNWW